MGRGRQSIEPSDLRFRSYREMRVLLIVLVLALCAGGVFLVARPGEGGIELRYAVSFPADFKGSRKEAGLGVVQSLGARLGVERRWWKAFVDKKGVITLCIAGAKPGEVPHLRRILEPEGRLEAYEIAAPELRALYDENGDVPPGYRIVQLAEPVTTLLLVSERPVFDTSDIAPTDPRCQGFVQRPTAYLELRNESALRYLNHDRDPWASEMLVVLDGKPFSTTPIDTVGMDGFFRVPGPKDEVEAQEIERHFAGGRLPYPIGAPDVSAFRGSIR
jgi:hypothetical protein